MKRPVVLVFTLLTAACVLGACGSDGGTNGTTTPAVGTVVQVEGGSYRDVTPSELYELLDDDTVFVLQYNAANTGNIPRTDLFLQYGTLSANMDKIPADKSAPIVLYCAVGAMSSDGAAYLVGQGYTQVYNLSGGLGAWRDQGYPVIAG